jgi:hypothetical protein
MGFSFCVMYHSATTSSTITTTVVIIIIIIMIIGLLYPSQCSTSAAFYQQ